MELITEHKTSFDGDVADVYQVNGVWLVKLREDVKDDNNATELKVYDYDGEIELLNSVLLSSDDRVEVVRNGFFIANSERIKYFRYTGSLDAEFSLGEGEEPIHFSSTHLGLVSTQLEFEENEVVYRDSMNLISLNDGDEGRSRSQFQLNEKALLTSSYLREEDLLIYGTTSLSDSPVHNLNFHDIELGEQVKSRELLYRPLQIETFNNTAVVVTENNISIFKGTELVHQQETRGEIEEIEPANTGEVYMIENLPKQMGQGQYQVLIIGADKQEVNHIELREEPERIGQFINDDTLDIFTSDLWYQITDKGRESVYKNPFKEPMILQQNRGEEQILKIGPHNNLKLFEY